MLNNWELEEDNDSDYEENEVVGSFVDAQKAKSSQQGSRQNRGFPRASDDVIGKVVESRVSKSSSQAFYSDGDSDIDAEELPAGHIVSKSIERQDSSSSRMRAVQNTNHGDNRKPNTGNFDERTRQDGVNRLNSEGITIGELREAFDEILHKATTGKFSGLNEVDKIDLSRAVRYIGSQALADRILNTSARKISWSALSAIAKPYVRDEDHGDSYHPMPIKESSSALKRDISITSDLSASPSELARGESVEKSRRLSVAFRPIGRAEETMHRVKDLPRNPPASSSEWSSHVRQPRDLRVTESMEQEAWHDVHGSSESHLRDKHSDESRILRSGNGYDSRSFGAPEGDRDRNIDGDRERSLRSLLEESKDEEVDGNRLHSGVHDPQDQRVGEEEEEEEEMFIEPSPNFTASKRKSLNQPSERIPQQDRKNSINSDATGTDSPPIVLRPTPLSVSPNIFKTNKSDPAYSSLISSDFSPLSDPRHLEASWGTAGSERQYRTQTRDDADVGRIGVGVPMMSLTPPLADPPITGRSLFPPPLSLSLQGIPTGSRTALSSSHKGESRGAQDTQVKRSISWSAAVTRDAMRPPRPKSMNFLTSSFASSSSWGSGMSGGSGDDTASHGFDGHLALPPLSEYAVQTGVILEGWLEKKSAVTGFWQKRYFVLCESSTQYCVLRIYYKVVESSWGTIPLKMKSSVPVADIKAVSAVSTKIKTGKQFSLTFNYREKAKKATSQSRRNSDDMHTSREHVLGEGEGEGSDQGGGGGGSEHCDSDGEGESSSKSMVLKAHDLKTKMIWTAMLEKVLHLYACSEV